MIVYECRDDVPAFLVKRFYKTTYMSDAIKTPLQSTKDYIANLLNAGSRNTIDLIWVECKNHRQNFERLVTNIKQTSVGETDFNDRMKKACDDYGYSVDLEVSKARETA